MKIIELKNVPWGTVSHNSVIKKRILLGDGELPGITTLSQAVFQPGDRAPAHAHTDMAEVFMVTSGTGIIRLNGREYRLGPDVVAVAEPHDIHEIINPGSADLILTYFGVRMQRTDQGMDS